MLAGRVQREACSRCASLGVWYTSFTLLSSRGEMQSRSRLPFHFPLIIINYISSSLINPLFETDVWCTTKGIVAKATASFNKKSGQSPVEQQLRVENTDMLGFPFIIASKAV